jgi:hypothetical protein
MSEKKSIENCIRDNLDVYFRDLDGTEPTGSEVALDPVEANAGLVVSVVAVVADFDAQPTRLPKPEAKTKIASPLNTSPTRIGRSFNFAANMRGRYTNKRRRTRYSLRPMRTSVLWLNDYLDRPADATEQAAALTSAGLPLDGDGVADNGEHWQEIETTSNRGDCLCHVGMAREVAAVTGRAVRMPKAALPAT